MPRTITIADDETGVTATVVIRPGQGDRAPRVTSVHIDANDEGAVTSESLRLLESIGLLPPGAAPRFDTDPVPKPAPAAPVLAPDPEPAPPAQRGLAAVPAAPAKTGRRAPKVQVQVTQRRNGPYRHNPGEEALIQAVAELGNASPTELAKRFNVPRMTMQSWLKKPRERGVIPYYTVEKKKPKDVAEKDVAE